MKNVKAGLPKILGIIIARLDSTRLPRKALRLVNNKPLIAYCINRALQINGMSGLVLATTDRSVDDELAQYVGSLGLGLYRGDTNNVAKRCLMCAKKYGAEYFLRINGDSPFIDHHVVERGFDLLNTVSPDIVSNLSERTFPYGISVEIVKVKTFEAIVPKMDEHEAEHVTKFFYNNAKNFSIHNFLSTTPELSDVRMVVDTPFDLLRFEKVIEQFGNSACEATFEDIAKHYKVLAAND